MAVIIIQNMGGIAPRVSPRLLPNGMATTASMTKLWSGELRPFMEMAPVFGAPMPDVGEVKTVYLLKDKWLAWTTDVNVVTGFTTLSSSGQIYYTGDGTPKQTNYTNVKFGPPTPIVGATYPIGVLPPQPVFTPSVNVIGTPSGDPLIRSYVYTLYTVNNEESVPSPPSSLVSVETGQSVEVGNFQDLAATDPLTYPFNYDNVKSLRLYRTFNNEFHFVAEIPRPWPAGSPATFTDSVLDQDLGEALQSQHYFPPPTFNMPDGTQEYIEGLIGLACGSLAAFHGNKVEFSEPYQPGAWPPEYEKVFDYPVVALGTFGQTCIVATTGYTYLVAGTDPRSFSVARVPDPYPCVSKRSMVSADAGCMYASSDGLIFIGAANAYTQYSGVAVLTRDVTTHDEWQAYNPSSIWGVINDGRYYGFYTNPNTVVPSEREGSGFIFDPLQQKLPGQPDDASKYDKDNTLLTLDFYASAGFANPQVPLKLVTYNAATNHSTLMSWEGGPDASTYVWRSKEFSFPYVVTFSAAKIIFNPTVAGSLLFRLLDGATGHLLFERSVNSTEPFRIPSFRPRSEWILEVEGTRWVQQIRLATAYADLMQQQAA